MSEGGQSSELREQDKWLPIANVYRIMKNSLPKNAKVSKEAKECVQECVSEFVSFITSEASEKCAAEKRKTVNGEDILYAMALLGFENYAEVLKIYLTKYREYLAIEKAKRDREKNGSYEGDEEEDNDGDIYTAGSEIDLKSEQYSYPAFTDEHQDASMYGEYSGEFSAVSGAQF